MQPNSFYISSFDNQPLFVETKQNSDQINQHFFLSHGLGGDSNSCIPLVDQLLSQIPHSCCVTWDLRSHGLSSNSFPKQYDSVEAVSICDLQTIINTIKPQRFYLIGHSFGGLITHQYLLDELSPQPQQAFLIATPIDKIGVNLNRKFWFSILKKLPGRTKDKRTTQQFLSHQNGWDFDYKRVLEDIKYTGLTDWLLIYLSLIGWRNQTIDKSDSEKITFIYSKNDLIIPRPMVEKLLKKMKKTHRFCLTANHHQPPLKFPQEIAKIIKDSIT